MVDFSLTKADLRMIDLIRQENEIIRRHAREIDRTAEIGVPKFRDKPHPDVAGTPDPFQVLKNDSEGTSGETIVEVLMHMSGARDASLREEGSGFGALVIGDFGSDEQKKLFGDLRLAIGITEPGAGSDPGNMASNWRYDAATDEYILNGEKCFIGGINKYDGAVTLLRGVPDEKGRRVFSSFVVLKSDKGFHEQQQFQKLGQRHHDIGGYVMDNIRVPAVRRLKADFSASMSRFNYTRPLVTSFAIGSCRSLLDFTAAKLAESGIKVDYGTGRGARSAAADKLIRLEALWEAAWCSIIRVKWLEHKLGVTSLDYQLESSISKEVGGKVAREITQGCLELLGPEGLSEEYLAEKWFRDARLADIWEGAGEIHRIVIARALLGYKKGQLD